MDMTQQLKAAHKKSIYHRAEILASETCGCFYCLTIFSPQQITQWTDPNDETALCPECDIDSVLGSASGFPITTEFLTAMREHWFGDC